MSATDCAKRLQYARRVKRLYDQSGGQLFIEGISLYLDAVGFAFKRDPYDQATTPGARVWRRPNEGLDRGCTTKVFILLCVSEHIVLCRKKPKVYFVSMMKI